MYGLKGKHYKSESIENLLIDKLSQLNEKSYIYNEIIAFLISISSKKVIPYIEKTLFTESKIDDEIYTELKNNLSDDRETGLHIWFQQKIRISKRMWVHPKALLAL